MQAYEHAGQGREARACRSPRTSSILFGEDDVTPNLEEVLLENPRVQKEHELYIRADKDAHYGVGARAVAAAGSAGVTSLNLLVDPELAKP